jgi:acetyl esterase/lipase
MKTLRPVLFLLLGGLVLPMSARAEDKPASKEAAKIEVEKIKDIAYTDAKDADPDRNKLDLYLPKGQKGFPTIVYIHGGGWTGGSRGSAGRLAETFVKSGIAMASVGYRLSPKVKHPVHIQDVAKAFAWVKANIAKHGGKPDQLYISGHSAGGHLAALLATNESYLKAEKLSLADIKGAIPISGVYRVGSGGRMKNVFGEDEAGWKDASPMNHITSTLPPFLILYADKDLGPIGKQSADMTEALKKAKVDAEGIEVKERNHGTIIGFIPRENDPTTVAILAFIGKHSGLKIKTAEAKP